jgi:hypothetical protein
MRDLCEVTWTDDSGEEPKTVRDKYFLLHFGLCYNIIEGAGVSYTVAICQNVKTGQLEFFSPDQLRIIGVEIKK